MRNKGDSRRDQKKNKRKKVQQGVFGHSSNETKTKDNVSKKKKQKRKYDKRSDKKYHMGGSK